MSLLRREAVHCSVESNKTKCVLYLIYMYLCAVYYENILYLPLVRTYREKNNKRERVFWIVTDGECVFSGIYEHCKSVSE